MKRLSALVLFLALSCAQPTPPRIVPAATPQTAAPAAVSAAPVHVVIVGTTDLHGWFNGHSESKVHYGGLSLLASYVDALRAANPGHVVLVDSGDLFQGTLESNLFEGEAVVKGYNALGYTAAAVGNHEFDYGPVGPHSVAMSPTEDPLGALKRNAGAAHFPFLSANLTEKATGQTPAWARRSQVVDVDGVKVGIIGISTPDTPNVTTGANIATLDFGDPVPATVHEAADLRAHGVDAIVVIAHMGGRCTDMRDVHDVASCESDQEVMHYLDRLPPGTIDAYFAGHTHAEMRQVIRNVAVMQAGPFSRAFSTLDLYVDPATHHVITDRTNLRMHTAVCAQVYQGTETCDAKLAPAGAPLVDRVFEGKTIAPEPAVQALFTPYLEKVEAKRNEPLGVTVTAPITRNYTKESEMGDLLTDLYREASGADIAFLNSGGLRANFRPGKLIYADIFEVLPFDNYPAMVVMTGQQVADALRLTTTGERGILQVSGLRYTVDATKDADKPAGQRNHVVSITLPDGRPLDLNATYKVALPDFLAWGGDGLAPVINAIPKDRVTVHFEQAPLRDIIADALRKHGPTISPKIEGRITVLNAKERGGNDS